MGAAELSEESARPPATASGRFSVKLGMGRRSSGSPSAAALESSSALDDSLLGDESPSKQTSHSSSPAPVSSAVASGSLLRLGLRSEVVLSRILDRVAALVVGVGEVRRAETGLVPGYLGGALSAGQGPAVVSSAGKAWPQL